MDNCGPHDTDWQDSKDQFMIFALPRNCSSIHRPMDMEIITVRKTLYRTQMFRNIAKDLKSLQKQRDDINSLQSVLNGMTEVYDPHMLDVATLVKSSWDEVLDATNFRCWIKSESLPT